MEIIDSKKYNWVITQLNNIKMEFRTLDFFTLYLFEEALRAYIFNLPYASILCITTAWNSLLRKKLFLKPDKKNKIPSTNKMLKTALDNGLINPDLCKKIQQFQNKIRNEIEHSKDVHPYYGVSDWRMFTDPDIKGIN